MPSLPRPRLWVGLLFTILWIGSADLHAQAPFGVRLGGSADPGQFYFGVHTESEPLIRGVRFRPNVEAGFGDNRTIIAINGEFIRRFDIEDGFATYVGAGPALNIVSLNSPFDDTDVGPGVNFLLGLDFPQGVFTEVKIGVIDSPGFKFGVGYTFP